VGIVKRLRTWLRSRKDPRLSRFIFSRRHFSDTQNIVKHGAFMPPVDGKLSIFDTDGVEERTVWSIGQEIAIERDQTLYARGDISTSSATGQNLRVIPDEPPPRHRNIVGWPPADQKEDQKLIAMELAAVATLRVP
jgi:hypothetical protein